MIQEILAQSTPDFPKASGYPAFTGTFLLIWGLVAILYIAALWKIFTKAGQPGWAAIIPIYNIVVFMRIIGRPDWWVILFIIPLVNIVILIIGALDLAKSFGKRSGFAAGLIILGFIFYPILAFGSSRYVGPAAGTT